MKWPTVLCIAACFTYNSYCHAGNWLSQENENDPYTKLRHRHYTMENLQSIEYNVNNKMSARQYEGVALKAIKYKIANSRSHWNNVNKKAILNYLHFYRTANSKSRSHKQNVNMDRRFFDVNAYERMHPIKNITQMRIFMRNKIFPMTDSMESIIEFHHKEALTRDAVFNDKNKGQYSDVFYDKVHKKTYVEYGGIYDGDKKKPVINPVLL